MNDKKSGGALSPFKPDFGRILKVRASNSATITDLARAAGLDPNADFQYSDWSGVDWRGTDLARFDLSGSIYSRPSLRSSASPRKASRPSRWPLSKSKSGSTRIISGIQPTGSLHIGNYFGAVKRWVNMQEDAECIFFLADLHSLVGAHDPNELHTNVREMAAALIACGLDPSKTVIFNQSRVSAHAELSWILNCTARFGWLTRMQQFKEVSGARREEMSVALLSYPVLQAADVLLYQATHVPSGTDQLQHIDLIRDIANKFNSDFGELFILPEPLIVENNPPMMSLKNPGAKMSKTDASDMSRLNLTDPPDLVVQKIRSARTDARSIPDSLAALEARPEAKNLLTMYGALAGERIEVVVARFAGKSFNVLIPALAELAVETLRPISLRLAELRDDPAELDTILASGAQKAIEIAVPTLQAAYRAVGLR